jgi:tripartite-type tricarboxylate transporter receptor subunit TctC
MVRSICHALLVAGITAVGAPEIARSQPYPAKTITFVVPNLAGGSSDLIARAIGAKLSETTGRAVVIDNKPGASEMIATEFLARAAPDGYTIAILSNALAINETLSPSRRYEAQRDLLPVAKLAELPFALIVRSALPATSLKEFVAFAKANPGKLSYGHVGVGAPHYLTMEWFKRAAGVDLVPVPYKSTPPVFAGLLGGEIEVTMGALGGAIQFIQNGQIRALASMSNRRPLAAPDLPTVAEAGYPEFNLVPWMGIFLPAGTPVEIARKLEAEITQAATSPDVREQLNRVGLEAAALGSQEFSKLIARDIDSWARVIRDVGVKPE